MEPTPDDLISECSNNAQQQRTRAVTDCTIKLLNRVLTFKGRSSDQPLKAGEIDEP